MGIKNPKGLSINELDNTGHKMVRLNLINILTGSQSWNRQHHGQTIHSKEKLISMNLFKIIFDLHGYGDC